MTSSRAAAQPSSAMPPLRVDVLGPLRLSVGGIPVEVPGHRRRAVLALLALASGRAVSVEAIIDAVWPDDPPETGRQAVHSHVSRLRRHLGPAATRLRRVGPGYVLDLGDHELDASIARTLGRAAASQLPTDATAALENARLALSMWRGTALDEFADVAPLANEGVALTELYLQLRDDALEAALAGGGESVVSDALTAVRQEPLRERTATLLVRALAGEGRTADAMSAAAAYRRRLGDETGLDPGPAMRALEEQVAAGAIPVATAATRAPRPVRPVARPTGPMVGRDGDRAELHRLIDAQRMVTLTGPGGVGKTRLALDVAADLSERGLATEVVRLAAVSDADRVTEAVTSALGLKVTGPASVQALAKALAERQMVLLLDNCEHVAQACRELVASVLSEAPRIRVLATSRVTLHVPGEYVIRLQPLPVPRDATEVTRHSRQPSVLAFVEHARRRDPSLALGDEDAPAVVDVLRRLDGLPLAIELAAGQLGVLPIQALRDRLGRALDALAGDRPADDARQRSLRTTIDWSYRLLLPGEQALLRALAPFPAGLDLTSLESLARTVTSPDKDTDDPPDPLVALTRLVDASLVHRSPAGPARYTLLETVRDYLLEDLDRRGERADAERRFLEWARETTYSIGQGLKGPDEALADQRLRAELPNVRTARDLAREGGDVDLLVDITLALDEPAVWRDITELWTWSLELAADPAVRDHPQLVAILGSGAEASWLAGDLDQADRLSTAGLQVRSGTTGGDQRSRCWSAAAAIALFKGDFHTARQHWISAAGASEQPAPNFAGAALAAGYAGDEPGATELIAQAERAESQRPCLSHRAFNAYVRGEIVAGSDQAIARQRYTAAIEIAKECGAGFVEGVASVGLASLTSTSGDAGAAARSYLLLLDYWGGTGNATQLWTTVRNVAQFLTDHGRHHEAALLLAAANASASAATLTGRGAERARQDEMDLERILGSAIMQSLREEAAALGPIDAARAARQALASLVEAVAHTSP